MTYAFSPKSLENLTGVHPRLVRTVHDVMDLQIMDFSVINGLRTREVQREYVRRGVSTTMHSKHLMQPDGYSHAVDLYPYPINMGLVNSGNWVELSRFGVLAGLMISCGKRNGVTVRWGLDWDRDGQTLDHSFSDAPHFEIVL